MIEGLLGPLLSTLPSMATMPASVMPLSQQLANMQIPNLSVNSANQMLPSLGVDMTLPTPVAPETGGPSFLTDLAGQLQDANKFLQTMSPQQPQRFENLLTQLNNPGQLFSGTQYNNQPQLVSNAPQLPAPNLLQILQTLGGQNGIS